MNLIQRAETLKKLIEVCDSEIFPKQPIPTYLVNKDFADGTFVASYNNPNYVNMILAAPLLLMLVVYTNLRFFLKRSWRNRMNVILSYYGLLSIKIGFDPESYFIVKQKYLLSTDLIKIAGIACHEVRHRFQNHYIRPGQYGKIKGYESPLLLRVYEQGREEACRLLSTQGKKYSVELESDALYIQHLIESRLLKKFNDRSFSLAEFRIFVQENKDLILWVNPYLK